MKNEGHLLPLEPDSPLDGEDFEKAKEAKRQSFIKAKENARISGLKQLMGSREGRTWMWSLLEMCGPYRNAFTGQSSTFFQCGQQYIGQHLIADLKTHCLQSFRQMEDESELTRG